MCFRDLWQQLQLWPGDQGTELSGDIDDRDLGVITRTKVGLQEQVRMERREDGGENPSQFICFSHQCHEHRHETQPNEFADVVFPA